MVAKTKKLARACGYCITPTCERYATPTFLLNQGKNLYWCPTCRQNGDVVAEKGHYVGTGARFKEVRVEFYWCPDEDKYQTTAVVRDDSIPDLGSSVYTLETPLIRTEQRALKVAEAILGSLSRYRASMGDLEDVPRDPNRVLYFDDSREKFSRELGVLAKHWEAGPR